MNATALARIAGGVLLISVLANLMAFAIGTSRGLLPPTSFDFGNAEHLLRLSAEYRAHLLPLMLGLLSPVLALPAGFAFFHVFKPAGWPAAFGTAMFFVGTVFVVLLDVLELVAVASVAPSYGAAPEVARPAVAAVGAALDTAIEVLGFVAHFFSFGLAQLAFGYATLHVRQVPNWLGGMSFVPAIAIGWLVPLVTIADAPAGPLNAVGILAFLIWLLGMAVILLRWQPPQDA